MGEYFLQEDILLEASLKGHILEEDMSYRRIIFWRLHYWEDISNLRAWFLGGHILREKWSHWMTCIT